MQELLNELLEQNKILKNEILNLKEQQNIFVKTLSDLQNNKTQNSLVDYMKYLASLDSARYIIEKMPKAIILNSAFEVLTNALKNIVIENGLYLEFGVYSGRSINHISSIMKDSIVYGFDSFEGLPEDWRPGFRKGKFAVDKLPSVNSNVELIKVWFDETLDTFLQSHTQDCAFIHVDCDLYSSTKTIFNSLRSRIKPGTVIVFDEYFNYPDWENGEFKAFQEFISESGLKYNYISYNRNHQQCAVKIIE